MQRDVTRFARDGGHLPLFLDLGQTAAVLSALLALPLLHLLPLPASLAIWGETRSQLAAQLADVEVAAPTHWSLNPQAAERALWFLLPALAMFAATWQLTTEYRRHLLIVLLGVALIGERAHWREVFRMNAPQGGLGFYEGSGALFG